MTRFTYTRGAIYLFVCAPCPTYPKISSVHSVFFRNFANKHWFLETICFFGSSILYFLPWDHVAKITFYSIIQACHNKQLWEISSNPSGWNVMKAISTMLGYVFRDTTLLHTWSELWILDAGFCAYNSPANCRKTVILCVRNRWVSARKT